MKNILFLLETYPAYGGIEGVTTQLSNCLAEQYGICICSHFQKDDAILSRLDSRAAVFALPDKSYKKSKKNIECLNSIIEQNNIDIIIHQDSYFPNYYLLKAVKRNHKGIKLLVAEHSSPNRITISYHNANTMKHKPWYITLVYDLLHYRNIFNDMVRRTCLYKISDAYVLLSNVLKPSFHQHSFIKDESKLYAIGNSVSLPRIDVDLHNKKKQCLFVGRLDVMKGIDKLVRIWHNVSAQIPDWELVVVGDGVMMPMLKQKIDNNELKNVRLEGFQTDVSKYYEDASIFLMCSVFEGFPLVVPEAMSRGCVPVIFNSFPVADELVKNGFDGFTIKAFDETSYAESVKYLIDDKQKLVDMQSLAIKASLKLDVKNVLQQWIELLENI